MIADGKKFKGMEQHTGKGHNHTDANGKKHNARGHDDKRKNAKRPTGLEPASLRLL